MQPLHQFVCDRCGGIINDPDQGYVVWSEVGNKINKILIVHKNYFDENGIRRGCDPDDDEYLSSLALGDFLGYSGLTQIIAMIDPGPRFTEEYWDGVLEKRTFIEFVRRVQTPYYEEARRYWSQAERDGFFDGGNEVWCYLPSTLQRIVQEYAQQPE